MYVQGPEIKTIGEEVPLQLRSNHPKITLTTYKENQVFAQSLIPNSRKNYLGEIVRALVLFTFRGKVKKRRYLKIYSLEFNEICQNSFKVSNFNHSKPD